MQTMKRRIYRRAMIRVEACLCVGRKVEGDEGFVLPSQKAAFTANTVVLFESRSERGQMLYTPVHREMFL